MRVTIFEVLGVFAVLGVILFAREYRAAPLAGHDLRANLVHPVSPEADVIQRRALVKNQLARRVAAERTPLLTAAEWFGQANGEDGTETLVRGMPGRSVREKLCRQVILFVA